MLLTFLTEDVQYCRSFKYIYILKQLKLILSFKLIIIVVEWLILKLICCIFMN